MRLVQYRDSDGRPCVAVTHDGPARRLDGVETVYDLACRAIKNGRAIADLATEYRSQTTVDLDAAEAEGRLLTPLAHPEPTRCWVTGTGLTHMGGAEARDKMHKKIEGAENTLTDSMKMFKWGVDGGKPAGGGVGVQPEWFYKGNGSAMVAPGRPLIVPAFALDGGEEPEVVGLYVIADDGTPCRVGYALGNEFTDHQMERQNYLYLAHSKLRVSAMGPEILLGALPDDIRGTSRILRGGKVIWEKPFFSGEANMSHFLSNLEYHHFKYAQFRNPGDVHLHFFGTSTLSFQDGIAPEPGDVFEVSAPPFGRPLRNPLARDSSPVPKVRPL